MERYPCWFAYGEPYLSHETIVEKMVGSTSSSNNVHKVVDDNNNPYRNVVMDVMRMN
jgi:V8-like Glu-specific endopeptidase